MRHRLAAVWIAFGGCKSSELPEVPPVVEREEAARVLAEETCRLLFACDCSVNFYRDEDHCLDVVELRGNDADWVAEGAELAYDGACVSTLATIRRELGCDVAEDGFVCLPCRPFFGTAAAGEPCRKLGVTVDVDTCAQGLRCDGGICVELCPTATLGEGEPCAAGIESLGTCEPGLHCDAVTQACTVSPALGEPCPDRICTTDAWCDLTTPDGPTCTERREAGASCFLDASCESDRCENERCTAPEPTVCSLPA
jgi:hypothetical protein